MSAPAPDTARQSKAVLKTVYIIIAVIAVILGLFFNKLMSPRVLSQQELMANGAVVFDKPRIIKDFELVNQHKQPFTLEDLQGKWSVVFFGFTACPDICPTTLATLSRWYKTLDSDIAEQTQVLMVSVDPARDTPEQLKSYMEHFNPGFIGVTGEFLTIKRLSDNLNVAFNKVTLDDDYTIDHSGHLVLVNPYGHYHGLFKPPFNLARLKLTYQSIVSTF